MDKEEAIYSTRSDRARSITFASPKRRQFIEVASRSVGQVEATKPAVASEVSIKSRVKSGSQYKIIAIAVICIILGAGIALGAVLLLNHKSLLPKSVTSRASFGIFYPSDNSVVLVNKASPQYVASTQRVVFNGTGPERASLSFSEQATPQAFIDVPTAYTKLVSSLNEYDSFDSLNGTVYLVKPKELNGEQSAVMNARGTLLFVQPNKTLSENDWRSLFNNLEVVK